MPRQTTPRAINRQVVNSHLQEFGYELLSSVPEAYMKHLNGTLTETISGVGSSALYYFSPKHTEVKGLRKFRNTIMARRFGAPYTVIHAFERPKLTFPPYKERYQNNEYKWEKPTLCICNRYNIEWKQPPINYFSTECLDKLFEMLKPHYEIIYFAVDLPSHIQDENHSMILKDTEVAAKHKVKIFQSFGGDWNETMLKIFANCEHYITMNGGYSILASYFSGTNIIYSKAGKVQSKEFRFNSFWRWYPNINDVRTFHVTSYEELYKYVQDVYVSKSKPLTFETNKYAELDALIKNPYINKQIHFRSRSLSDTINSRKYKVRLYGQ